MESKTFNLLVVGKGSVGKTSFIKTHSKKLQDAKFKLPIYTSTFNTNKGDVKFTIYESNTVENINSLGVFVHAAIIMVSSDVKMSFPSAVNIRLKLCETFGVIPTVLVVNKCDIGGSENFSNTNTVIRFNEKKCRAWGVPMILASTKGGYNCTLPFIYLIRLLLDGMNQPYIKYAYFSDIHLLQGQSEEEQQGEEVADSEDEDSEDEDFEDEDFEDEETREEMEDFASEEDTPQDKFEDLSEEEDTPQNNPGNLSEDALSEVEDAPQDKFEDLSDDSE